VPVIGTSVRRPDVPGKVTGAARYAGDLAHKSVSAFVASFPRTERARILLTSHVEVKHWVQKE